MVHSTIPACLHTVPEAVLVPLPAPHRQALSSASTEKSEKDYSDIKKKIDVQTYIFGIIAFANWNKEKAGDPHWNNPRDLCVLPEDFRCCCELGLCTSSRDLLWSMSWGGSYSQHDIPALASCGLLVVFSGIWNRLSLLAVLDRSPKLGLEVAAYSFPKRSKDAQLGGHSSLLRGLLAFHCEGLLQSRK